MYTSGPNSRPSTEIYSAGLGVGHRWYDMQRIEPLFEFGHGLSYTTFRYSKLRVRAGRNGAVSVGFRIHNTGDRPGDEIAQVYAGPAPDVPDGVQQAPRKLVQFERVHDIPPGVDRPTPNVAGAEPHEPSRPGKRSRLPL